MIASFIIGLFLIIVILFLFCATKIASEMEREVEKNERKFKKMDKSSRNKSN